MSKIRIAFIGYFNCKSVIKAFPKSKYEFVLITSKDQKDPEILSLAKHIIPHTANNLSFDSIYHNDYNLTYEQIEKYRATQLKIEHGAQRKQADMGIIQRQYFLALGFWLQFFQNNTIDLVFLYGSNHSAFYDCIALDVAISKNIPTFNLSTPLGFYDNGSAISILQLKNMNAQNFIRLDCDTDTQQIEHFGQSIAQSYQKQYFKTKKLDFPKPFKLKLQQARYSFYWVANTIKSPYQKYKESFTHQPLLYQHEFFSQLRYVKSLRKLYGKISRKPDLKENYIYYSLHQDPEASTMATTTLNAQLTIIQWLSQCLPKGWKLYVKEHPSQFICYQENPYFLKNIHYYRSMEFYRQIQILPNTRLIDMNTPSSVLIPNAKAIASICGSALLEATLIHKPILIFGQNVIFLELLQDAFNITSLDSLKGAINKIRGGYIPSYSDFIEIVSSYTLLSNDTNLDSKLQTLITNTLRNDN